MLVKGSRTRVVQHLRRAFATSYNENLVGETTQLWSYMKWALLIFVAEKLSRGSIVGVVAKVQAE
jgi:hypothetical protein